jgi:hypothetical protein
MYYLKQYKIIVKITQYSEFFGRLAANEKGLAFVGELEFRQPITEVDNCNIADVLFISQIYNVKPELKHNKEQMMRQYSSSPNNAKPNVGCRFILASKFVLWF